MCIRDRGRIEQLRARSASLQSQKEAHTYVANARWADIDHLGLARRIEELEAEIAKLRAANSILDALQAEEEKVSLLHKEANRTKVLDEDRLTELTKPVSYTHLDVYKRQALIVNGFVRDVLQQLPMEFAVEAQKLIAISLEGSVG